MSIKCHVAAWVTRNKSSGSVGRSKPPERTVASLMKDGVNTEQRRRRRRRRNPARRTPGIQRIKFQCVSCHLIIPAKMGLHLWMKKIPFCIQHCLSTWQYGGFPPSFCLISRDDPHYSTLCSVVTRSRQRHFVYVERRCCER